MQQLKQEITVKINFCLLLLTLFVRSCKTKEGSKLIYSQRNTDYGVTISTIDTKINNAGIAQCSKHALTTVSDTKYTS
ncbi:MAG: hypothetical protein ACJASF_002396 [Vicingaceae bacterium]